MNFPSINQYLDDDDTLVMANEDSRVGVHIPDIISENSSGFRNAMRTRAPVLPLMLSCLFQSQKSVKSITHNPKLGKQEISGQALAALEEYAKSLGISKIGYTKVDRDMIFRDKGILYENAIVFLMEMNIDSIVTAPSKTAIKEIFRTYNALGIIVNKVSEHLRASGFNAMAGPAIGGDVSYVPLAQKAGLGVIGKHGLLITDEDFGPSLRIAAVYTDIENLPVATENPHLWVREFCESCNICVRNCPAGAIYEHSIAINGNPNTRQCIDNAKCAVPFANEYGCTVCVKSCAFFKGDYHKIKTAFNKKKQKQ